MTPNALNPANLTSDLLVDAVFGVVAGFLTNDSHRFVAEVEGIEL